MKCPSPETNLDGIIVIQNHWWWLWSMVFGEARVKVKNGHRQWLATMLPAFFQKKDAPNGLVSFWAVHNPSLAPILAYRASLVANVTPWFAPLRYENQNVCTSFYKLRGMFSKSRWRISKIDVMPIMKINQLLISWSFPTNGKLVSLDIRTARFWIKIWCSWKQNNLINFDSVNNEQTVKKMQFIALMECWWSCDVSPRRKSNIVCYIGALTSQTVWPLLQNITLS
jgi:hypothetical protein